MSNKRKALMMATGAGTVVALAAAPAVADSPVVTASGGQCEAKWISSNEQFRLRDNDVNDSDYCYVHYALTQPDVANNPSRAQANQDVQGYQYRSTGLANGKTVYWKVCKERQNDNDICSSVRNDAT